MLVLRHSFNGLFALVYLGLFVFGVLNFWKGRTAMFCVCCAMLLYYIQDLVSFHILEKNERPAVDDRKIRSGFIGVVGTIVLTMFVFDLGGVEGMTPVRVSYDGKILSVGSDATGFHSPSDHIVWISRGFTAEPFGERTSDKHITVWFSANCDLDPTKIDETVRRAEAGDKLSCIDRVNKNIRAAVDSAVGSVDVTILSRSPQELENILTRRLNYMFGETGYSLNSLKITDIKFTF